MLQNVRFFLFYFFGEYPASSLSYKYSAHLPKQSGLVRFFKIGTYYLSASPDAFGQYKSLENHLFMPQILRGVYKLSFRRFYP